MSLRQPWLCRKSPNSLHKKPMTRKKNDNVLSSPQTEFRIILTVLGQRSVLCSRLGTQAERRDVTGSASLRRILQPSNPYKTRGENRSGDESFYPNSLPSFNIIMQNRLFIIVLQFEYIINRKIGNLLVTQHKSIQHFFIQFIRTLRFYIEYRDKAL